MLQLAFVNFKPNSFILIEGTRSNNYFFIIQSGKVRCYTETPIPGVQTEILGPGDFIGVISCMSGHTETKNVVAMTPVVAIMVQKSQYSELIMHNTPVAMKIVRSFSRDMRIVNDQLTKLTVNKANINSPEQIFAIADFYENQGYIDIAAYAYYQYIRQNAAGVNIEKAKKRLLGIKAKSKAVYYESNNDPVRVYPKNTMIFSDCQLGADMFIIQEGSVRISKVVDGQEVTFAILKKGDMFGEMALLENKPRSASAIAHESCRLMVVNRSNFDHMVATQPQMISKLTTMLADRMWSMYRQLANTQIHDLREKLVDQLALQMEKQRITYQGSTYTTSMTPTDLFNFCGIPRNQVDTAYRVIQRDQNVKIVDGKIAIPNVDELIKQAAFYRKQSAKQSGM